MDWDAILNDDKVWVVVRRRLDLYPSEAQVLRLACAGLCIKEIAFELGKSDKTVQQQRRAAFRALKALCVEAAIRQAMTLALEIWRERQRE